MGVKVLITPRSFGSSSPKPIEMLRDKDIEVVLNPYGRIMRKQEIRTLIKDMDGVIIGVDPLNEEVLSNASRLKVISKYGVGTDNIDMDYTKKRGIPVTITAGANSDAVADYAFALMLGVARRMTHIDRECRKLNWEKITTLGVWKKTLGLIGMGNIGKEVAKRASGFNMRILVYDIYRDEDLAKALNAEYVSLEGLLKASDFISLHLPLTDGTRDLISYREFEQMKDRAVLVNTARGGIINEDALLWALKGNRIWGAGIDVFEKEPPDNQEFFKLDNLIIGSHCAASTYDAVDNMGIMAAQNLIKYIYG